MDYFAGIDIGSSSTKGILSEEDGTIVAKVNKLHSIGVDPNGKSEVFANKFFKEVIWALSELLREARVPPSKLKCISLSGFESVTFIGRNGKEERPSITYLDSRSENIALEFANKVGRDVIFDRGKNRPSSIFEGYKIMLAFSDGKVKNNTFKISDVARYAVFKLTGEYTMDYSTAMLFAPFYNQSKDNWDDELISLAGIDVNIFPELADSQKIIGYISRESSEKYGLSSNTCVTVGTQDAYASLLGDNVISQGDSSFIYGTSGVFDIVHDGSAFSDAFANTRHIINGRYVAEAAMYNAGSLLNWFGKNYRKKLVELDRIVEKKNRPGSVVAIPFFSGERAPIWNNALRGAFINLTLESDFIDMYLGLMEAVGYWLKYSLDKANNSGIMVNSIVASGGGIKSSIWPQIISDITGLDQKIMISEGASQGDLYLSLMASGLINNFNKVADIVKPYRTIKADVKAHERYIKKYKKFESLLKNPHLMEVFEF